jgi:uncharacterized membrane protein
MKVLSYFDFFRKHSWTILIVLVFATIYSLMSFVNHYYFRTGSFDLGIYNNAIYDYSKFQVNDNPVMHKLFDNILSDHFSLLLIIFAPFRYIFGSYTLLIFQVLAILFGGLGAYKFVVFITHKKLLGRLALIHFFASWAIFSALSFDYHDNVVGAMFVPWVILFFFQKKWRWTALFTLLVLVSKENMSIWMVFVFLGLLLLKIKDKEMRRAAAIGSIFSLFYFIMIVGVVMPSLANDNRGYKYMAFSQLGESPSEIIMTLFKRPKFAFSLLFENYGNEIFDGIKTELHYVVLLSGGIALIYRPQFLVMLLPIYAQKLFNDGMTKWGINLHYSIEFTAILTIAFFYWITQSKLQHKYKTLFLGLGVLVSILISYSVMEKRKSKWYNGIKTCFYRERFYETNIDLKTVYSNLKALPDEARVCAQSILLPHLAMRERIYTYPHIRDAEYIVLLPVSNSHWPYKKEKYYKKLEELKADTAFQKIIDDGQVLLLKRK